MLNLISYDDLPDTVYKQEENFPKMLLDLHPLIPVLFKVVFFSMNCLFLVKDQLGSFFFFIMHIVNNIQ